VVWQSEEACNGLLELTCSEEVRDDDGPSSERDFSYLDFETILD
jgi:hypothetical protein